MYSSKESVNQLTALLVAYGVGHAVVCPGSRNAPIVHNLSECDGITCHAVTDERSAGFYALGMAQALHQPVAVCVTSGTALLNLAPAVAEAWYQHLPLIVISADRPTAWIGQLDGQTLPQQGALGCFVRTAVTLPEDNLWHCNRLLNEALLAATDDDNPRPVHINVPISEPLFTFGVARLPAVRQMVRVSPPRDYGCLNMAFVDGLLAAQRPMIVFGQTSAHNFEGVGVSFLFSHVIVLHEATSAFPSVSHFDEVLSDEEGGAGNGERLLPPDFIIYVGDVIVSKRLRRFLRRDDQAQTWRISASGDVEDTFQNLRGIIVGDPEMVLQSLSHKLSRRPFHATHYRRQWLAALTRAAQWAADYQPPYSQMAAVRLFEQKYSKISQSEATQASGAKFNVHYANSTAIRLANIYARHHVWCNRGVNGIEGSLSTAAGFSLVTGGRVFCVIGDLSFFYDQNALWNHELRSNLRILLLNNRRGGIFNLLPGLEQSPARDSYVAAAHGAHAEGVCLQNNVAYFRADSMEQLGPALDNLFSMESTRPVLLEVVTDAADDARAYTAYYRH